jgi:chromosome partitioning protein
VKTIALAAAKGGVGKTTLAAALATAAILATPGLKIAVADLDPQGSLTRWWNTRALPNPAHVDLTGRSIEAGQRKLRAAGLDVLILDCPPGYSTVLREAIAASDLVLVPTGASVLDLTAVTATAEMAKREGVPFHFVLNRAVFRSRLAGQAVQTLRERGGLLWPPVHQRVPVAAAMAAGRTALETEPDGAAARELSALWHAVRANLECLAPGRRSALTVARSRA